MHLQTADFAALERFYRRNLFNTLPGPRGLHLIGTKSHRGVENLGVFSSVVHLGAGPPLLGFVLRPLTVPRHTYHHLKAQGGHFTLNTVHPGILEKAHQTSANYPLETSEFAATGLTPLYSELLKAPYVAESPIRIGLELVEEHHIKANDTLFLVGKIIEIFVPDEYIASTGHVEHQELQTMTVAGLDTYFNNELAARLGYARP
ncbi:MAG: flavin oxidoreductase [Bacteroidetes bacterium]|nr:MAG: flavin oxidoreductase [Bacteroidota bacterium]PTM13921.1 MAG: flavin oxidoreductase [Bacteroidota bacterium]